MKHIRLTEAERSFLGSAQFLPADVQSILAEQLASGSDRLSIDDTTAERLRAAFTEELARVGFDIDYNLTEPGKALERLIDAFA